MEHILKKVYGVELASQKVELGLVEDLMKEYAKLSPLGIEMEMLSLANDLSKKAPMYKSLKSKFDDLMKKAKEIGADKIYSDAKDFSDGCSENIKRIDKQVSSIKSMIKR